MPASTAKENIEFDLLFFGATADISGVRRVRRSMASDTIVSKMLEQLIEEYPKLSTLKLLVPGDRHRGLSQGTVTADLHRDRHG